MESFRAGTFSISIILSDMFLSIPKSCKAKKTKTNMTLVLLENLVRQTKRFQLLYLQVTQFIFCFNVSYSYMKAFNMGLNSSLVTKVCLSHTH